MYFLFSLNGEGKQGGMGLRMDVSELTTQWLPSGCRATLSDPLNEQMTELSFKILTCYKDRSKPKKMKFNKDKVKELHLGFKKSIAKK